MSVLNDVSGVYCIFNIVNEKIYIGSSIHIYERWQQHKYFLKNNIHYNKHLQAAWNKYGEENFKFEIIEIINTDEENLLEVEQIWMDYYSSYDASKGYNISAYAEGAGGYIVSEETKEKIRNWHTGRKSTEETKKKLSEQRKGENNNFYGKHHTEEAKKKISEAKKGKKVSEKTLKALREYGGKKSYTEETYQKLKKSHQGENSASAKLTEKDVIEILKLLKESVSYKEISEIYNISITQISRIKHKKRWGHLYEKYPELYA